MEQRMTLISDATNEFPNNTSSNFRVRIPDGLRLPGRGWHVALLSLTLPNAQITQERITTGGNHPHQSVLSARFTSVHLKDYRNDKYNDWDYLRSQAHLGEKTDVVTPDGVSYWNSLITAFNNDMSKVTRAFAQSEATSSIPVPLVLLSEHLRPVFRWEGEDLIVARRGAASMAADDATQELVTFDMNLDVARTWGFVAWNGTKYVPGPNVRFNLNNYEITSSVPPIDTSGITFTGFDRLHGKAHRVEKHNDKPSFPDIVANGQTDFDELWVFTRRQGSQRVLFVRFSGYCEWRFINLNQTYQTIHQHVGQAVMVYTNLQQSTIVGGQTAQLLRELVIQRGGAGGHSYSEPTHLQWIPVSTHQADIVEVQLTDVMGNFLSLPPGKSLVTVALKQML